jgi:hypothetical protein
MDVYINHAGERLALSTDSHTEGNAAKQDEPWNESRGIVFDSHDSPIYLRGRLGAHHLGYAVPSGAPLEQAVEADEQSAAF